MTDNEPEFEAPMDALDGATARRLVDAVLARARRESRHVGVAVVDAHGHDILVVRDDDAGWFTPAIARAKAATAVAMNMSTVDLAGLGVHVPGLLPQIGAQLPLPLTTLPGGIPIRSKGRAIAAVGVSGAASEEDVIFAAAAQRAFDVDARR
jgi:glc operon protein GlcG